MYKTSKISKEALEAIQITNQDEIVEFTGSKLDPVKAWEVLKKASKDFSVSDAKTAQADALLFELLFPEKKREKVTRVKTQNIEIQEKERARALALLELELLIAA